MNYSCPLPKENTCKKRTLAITTFRIEKKLNNSMAHPSVTFRNEIKFIDQVEFLIIKTSSKSIINVLLAKPKKMIFSCLSSIASMFFFGIFPSPRAYMRGKLGSFCNPKAFTESESRYFYKSLRLSKGPELYKGRALNFSKS